MDKPYFKVIQGHYNIFGTQIGDNGYTIEQSTPMGSHHFHVETIEEVEEERAKFDPEAIEAQAKATADFLTKPENAWWRS